MFTQISWSSYIVTVLLLSAVYYLFIGYGYYRDDLLKLVSGKRVTTHDFVSTAFRQQPLKESFSDEVKAFMNEAAKNKMSKKDILESLQLLFKKYPTLKDSASQESIKNLIVNECASYCCIHLSDEEFSELWN